MVCRACGKESADDFPFCPHCGKQKATEKVCPSCAKESAGEFSFCPYCGKAFAPIPSVIEPPGPSPEPSPAAEQQSEEQAPTKSIQTDRSNKIGTYVFGAFAVLALIVSIVKGIVPIYLFESAVWAGAAWYWHRKKTHSELAKAIVIVLAALVAIGEVVQVAREFNKPSTVPVSQSTDPFEKYRVPPGSSSTPYSGYVPTASPDQTSTQTGSAPESDVAEVEQQAVALFNQKQYKEARPLFEQACDGTDENGFKYAGFDGEMKACNYLGYLYAQGLGGSRDTRKAHDVYLRACNNGILSSCASLGSLYQDAGDDDNARRYFEKACDGGAAEACNLLRGVR
jgi:hypothetical protein